MKKKLIFLSFVLGVLLINPFYINSAETKNIVMCRPLVSQIKNIVFMQEFGILPVEKIKLVCIYHEDELTSYSESKKYIKSEGLSWVSFRKIRGNVGIKDLFKKNKWTSTFVDIIKNSDGIIFTGGMDIPPAIYGERTSLLSEPTTPFRSYYEISFLFHLIGRGDLSEFVPVLEGRKNYPVLAICLGEQSLNIAAGGTLIQDIPSEVYKINSFEDVLKLDQDKIHSIRYLKGINPGVSGFFYHFHKIKLKTSKVFKKAGINIKNTPFVLSSHHQSVEKIGKELNIIATSMDGKIVEALEHKRYENVLALQFHPEVYKLYKKGRFFRTLPDGELNFNPRSFLENNFKSMEFHKKIWNWFASSL